MSKRGIISYLVSGIVCLVCSVDVVPAQPLYNVTHIPNPYPPDQYSSAAVMGINDLGQVVGTYLMRDEMANLIKPGAFIYSDATGIRDLPFPSGMHTPWVEGINNSGQVTLYGRTSIDAPDQSYRYTPGVGYQNLGTLGENTESRAINNLGQVTGFSGRGRMFRYTDGVGMDDLGPGSGRDINDRGWIAGAAGNSAVLVRDGNTIDLGPGRAHGINNAGDVVGETYIVPGHDTAFVYLNDGQMFILGDADFAAPVLNDINDRREAVGYGFVGRELRPLYWSEATGGLVDLNTMIPENSGWTLGLAAFINEQGQIIGFGGYNGRFAMFRLDPNPETLLARCIAQIRKPEYSLLLIPSPDPDQPSWTDGRGLNDRGQVVGDFPAFDYSNQEWVPGIFVYSDRTGSRALVPTAPGIIWAWGEKAINNRGQITLYAPLDGVMQAYRYTPRTGYQHLGSFGGDTQARAINNLGQVAGFSVASDGRAHIFRYTDRVGLEDLGPGFGLAINDHGWVAGSRDGSAVLLNKADTITFGAGEARGINNRGDVVGTGFVYLDGTMTILDDPRYYYVALNDINGKREAVGFGYVILPENSEESDQRAVYWSEHTGLVDLNTLIPGHAGLIGGAAAINESGQITGPGYRLDPLPNPAKRLLPILKAAAASLKRGRFHAAMRHLAIFQKVVRAQLMPEDPAKAQALINSAQDVISAIKLAVTTQRCRTQSQRAEDDD